MLIDRFSVRDATLTRTSSIDTSNLSVDLDSHVSSEHYDDLDNIADKWPSSPHHRPHEHDHSLDTLHKIKPGERDHTRNRRDSKSQHRPTHSRHDRDRDRLSSSPTHSSRAMTNGRRRDGSVFSRGNRTRGVSADDGEDEEDSDAALRLLLADPDDHEDVGVEYVLCVFDYLLFVYFSMHSSFVVCVW